MVKKNQDWWKVPAAVIATIASVAVSWGVITNSNIKFVKFITVVDAVEAADKKIEAVAEDVGDIKDYIKGQQITNDLLQKIAAKDEPVVISRDGKTYWDKEKQKWLPIKK